MTLRFLIEYLDGNERFAVEQQLTRLHPCPMHPCQLLLLALHSDPTRKFDVLLGHEFRH
jgi:hypothetical protein